MRTSNSTQRAGESKTLTVINSCSRCSRALGLTGGYFELNNDADRLELVCSNCFDFLGIKSQKDAMDGNYHQEEASCSSFSGDHLNSFESALNPTFL
jgi:hypothetical protein